MGTEIQLDSRNSAIPLAVDDVMGLLDRTSLRVNKYPTTNCPSRASATPAYTKSKIVLHESEAEACCCTSGAGGKTIAKESIRAAGIATGANTRREMDGSQKLTAACASIAIVTMVQTACFTEVERTRQARNASHANAANPSERSETSAIYAKKSAGWVISLLLFATHDLFRQTLEFLLIQNLVVDHSDQELLDGSAAQPVDDLLHGFHRDVLRGFEAAVDVCAAFHAMFQISLVFEPAQDGADRGILHRMPGGQRLSYILGGG